MQAKKQAFAIFPTNLISHYPLPLSDPFQVHEYSLDTISV